MTCGSPRARRDPVAPTLSGASLILPDVSDFAVPLPIPDVATAIEEADARRRAAGQRLFQFLIDVDAVDLREETIQQQLFDSNARDATIVVAADVYSLAFARAATSLAEAIGGALAHLSRHFLVPWSP